MNQEQIDWTLVRKRIDGSLTDEERERLERWIGENRERQRFVEHACRYYERELPVIDEERITRAWQHFAFGRSERRKRRVLVRWASTVAASVILVAGTWMWWQRPKETQIVEIMTRQEIPGGSNRARLLMSDGREVDLATGKSQQVIMDGGVNMLLDSVSLSYEKNQITEDTLYNTIVIPRGGEFHIMLSDGTRVWLNAESRLTYPLTFGSAERRVRLEGEAYFEVKPGTASFVVEAGGMNVRVLGTAFNVNAYDNESKILTTLVHGKIEVLTAGDSLCRILVPGEQAVLDRETGLLEVMAVNTDLYTRWINGQFVFRDSPLRDIMRVLSRWYEMKYEFTDPDLELLRFYGVISRFGQVEELLEQFEKTGKVHFDYQGNKIIIKK